jgi:predicted nuclease of predicted toxin-antitoxin system
VKLWFDEDLSPTLVQVVNELGLEATCNRDRAMLGSSDPAPRRAVNDEGFVLVSETPPISGRCTRGRRFIPA